MAADVAVVKIVHSLVERRPINRFNCLFIFFSLFKSKKLHNIEENNVSDLL